MRSGNAGEETGNYNKKETAAKGGHSPFLQQSFFIKQLPLRSLPAGRTTVPRIRFSSVLRRGFPYCTPESTYPRQPPALSHWQAYAPSDFYFRRIKYPRSRRILLPYSIPCHFGKQRDEYRPMTEHFLRCRTDIYLNTLLKS